jgi:DNA repair protein RadC
LPSPFPARSSRIIAYSVRVSPTSLSISVADVSVLATPTVYVGSLNTTWVRVSEVFRDAIRQNAAALIVAHNHPSGDPSPSPEDVALTREIISAGKLLDIEVLDHLIIGHQRFVSLKERGLAFE